MHVHSHPHTNCNVSHCRHDCFLNTFNSPFWSSCPFSLMSSWSRSVLISLLLEADRCKLYCKAENFEFFFAMSGKVKDGTPCFPNKRDVCIDGICEVREHFCIEMCGHACVSSYQTRTVRSGTRDSVSGEEAAWGQRQCWQIGTEDLLSARPHRTFLVTASSLCPHVYAMEIMTFPTMHSSWKNTNNRSKLAARLLSTFVMWLERHRCVVE